MNLQVFRPAVVLLAFFTVLTGLVYPLAMTGVAQVLFPSAANGSLVVRDGKVVGSSLVCQPFDDPKFFWNRPSATGPVPCNGASSSGSNLGPTNPAQLDAVKGRADALRAADPSAGPPPADLVTASGSGLDPHVSPEAAYYQAPRVAQARGIPEDVVRALVQKRIEPRTLGLLGEPRVNVLLLNLDLEDASP